MVMEYKLDVEDLKIYLDEAKLIKDKSSYEYAKEVADKFGGEVMTFVCYDENMILTEFKVDGDLADGNPSYYNYSVALLQDGFIVDVCNKNPISCADAWFTRRMLCDNELASFRAVSGEVTGKSGMHLKDLLAQEKEEVDL